MSKMSAKNKLKLTSDRCSILNGQRRSHILIQIPRLASQLNTMGKPGGGWFYLNVQGCKVCDFCSDEVEKNAPSE